MATVTRYSVAKTQKSYDPAGVDAVCGSKVYSETHDLRDCYYYGGSTTDGSDPADKAVGGDVSPAPAPDFDRLDPKTGPCA